MNKDKILEDVKNILESKIKTLDYKNLTVFEDEVSRFIEFLKITHKLPIPMESEEFESGTEVPLPERETEIESNKKITPATNNEEEKIYEFKREVRGGKVLGLNGEYFIPEKMTMDMGLKNGYKVKVVGKTEKENRTSYHFEIHERTEKPDNWRQEYNFCRVEKEVGELVVKQHASGDIRIDEVPYTFIIKRNDVDTYNLKEGDIIDIAFSKEKPEKTMLVLTKHDLGRNNSSLTIEQRKLNYTERRQLEEAYEKETVVNKELFRGKKVLIVGGGTRKKDYLDSLEKLNATVEHATGDEGKVRISSMISRADVVAITIGQCSHDASIYTVSECKKQGKPFASTDRNGTQSLLLCVEEALNKKEGLVS